MSVSETISDFRVEVTDSVLADLERRLRATRWPEPSPGAGWDYGMDLGYLRELTSSWIGFDWRTAEAEINRLPQFECLVGLERIHFVHLCGKGPAPLPIILTHGWPASFLEFRHIIEPLADPGAHGGDPDDAFDVVVPSLPGYAFSPPPVNPATTKKTIAELWRALMVDALGYERFVAHGGDIGCGVTTRLGLHHADVVAAIHLIHLFESPYIGPGATPLNAAEQAYQEGLEQWAAAEGAYREV
jgi:pimeloyl-ACP methyl ester carboxylesterase